MITKDERLQHRVEQRRGERALDEERGVCDCTEDKARAGTAGLLILAAAEEMLDEAHEVKEDTRISADFFIAGFALFGRAGGAAERTSTNPHHPRCGPA